MMPKAGSAVGPRPIAHVIFDVDGTLVDNLDLIARSYNYAIKEFVHREFSRDEVYAKFGPPMKQMVTQTVPAEHAAAAIQRYQDHYRENFHQYARVYPGIPNLISGLRDAGITISAYTGADARMNETTMEETGLRDVFSVVVTANDVTELKPSPEGLIRAMELAHANPDKALYLGDAVKDMEAARRAGIKSAAALWGFGDSQLLRAQHPDFAFKDPIDALNQLTN